MPFFIIVGLFFLTVRVENYVNKLSKNPDVLVQVDAFKWNWQFEYLQDHGTTLSYPRPRPLRRSSTVGSSEEIPILVIPVGETVQFIEHSEDVIHSFWVPEFLFKRDVIPYGTTSTTRDNRFEITATSTGSFVGRCAELCGTYHSHDELRGAGGRPGRVHELCGRADQDRSGRPGAPGQGAQRCRAGAVRHHHAPVQHRPRLEVVVVSRRTLSMKVESRLFLLTALFCFVVAAIYGVWTNAAQRTRRGRPDWRR